MISKKYRTLVSNNGVKKLYFLFFSSIFVIFFEMLGIGSVPMFAYIIIDPEAFLTTISQKFGITYDLKIDKKKLVLISGLAFFIIFLFKNLAIVLIRYLELNIIKIFREDCSKNLFNYFLTMPYSYYLNTNPAVTIRTINADITHAFALLLAKIRLIREYILLIFIVSALIYIDPLTYTLSFLFFVLVAAMFYYFYKKVITSRARMQLLKNTERLQILNQSFYAIKEIKILNKQNFFSKVFAKNTKTLENIGLFTTFVSSLPRNVYELMAIMMILFFTLLLVMMDYSQSAIIPVVALLVASGARFIPAFNIISSSMSSIRFTQPMFDNVIACLDSLNKNNFDKKLNRINQENLNYKKTSFRKKIEINNLNFDYDGKRILENSSFAISQGSTIGIIGKSGEGKSTIVNLIVGLLKPTSGEILVDDENIEKNLINWQRKIGYISQDTYLMDDTIKSNICFGLEEKDIDNKNFNKALEQAQIYDFVNNLKEKEYTKIGNLGSRISGGQKQRIAIARALYLNPEILILDEATSSLDPNVEKLVLENINKYYNLTMIQVSHRYATLKNTEKIIYLKSGFVKDIDTLENLSKKDTEFIKLFNL